MFDKLEQLLDPISKVFDSIAHPIQTLQQFTDIILTYIPAICVILFLFYIVTGSRKILNSISFTFLIFILLKSSVVFNFTWLFIVVVISVLIIRLVGSVM